MRKNLLKETAKRIHNISQNHPVRVGIDGVSASGKTCFADDLIEHLKNLGRDVIRASIDGFHNTPKIRYQQGQYSISGYIEDSFDYNAVINHILEPLGPSGKLKYKKSQYNFLSSEATNSTYEIATKNSVLIFDGVMLFNNTIHNYFDYKIYIDASFNTILERAIKRDSERLGGKTELLKKYNDRYIPGQKSYITKHKPHEKADLIIDNNNFDLPVLVKYI